MLPKPLLGSLRRVLSESSKSRNAAPLTSGTSSSSSSAAIQIDPPPAPHPVKRGHAGSETVTDVIEEMFLLNKLGGPDVARLARGARRSEAKGVDKLAAVGTGGKHPKNYARDIMRLVLQGTTVPPLFWYPVRVWDPVEQRQEVTNMPFNLPHRMLSCMGSSLNDKYLAERMAPEYRSVFETACGKLGLDPSSTIPIGLHGDGVPFTKKDSVELLSYNFLGEPMGDRIPFSGISKMYCCKCGCLGRHTFDDMLEVFAWSLRALLCGVHPSIGPRNEPLVDAALLRDAGTPLQCPKAMLCQVRGDWPFLKQLFSVPVWNNFGICWLCFADKDENSYKDGRSNANWRGRRKTWHQFFQELRDKGLSPSPLFSAPGFELFMIVLDWLHIVDLGVAQDLTGSLFHEFIRLPGQTKAQNLKVPWTRLREFYRAAKVACRLDNLTEEMIEKPGKSPKLRAKGGETRQLIPFAAELAEELALTTQSEHWRTVAAVFDRLFSCCKHIDAEQFNADALAKSSRELCILWTVLENEASNAGKLVWVKKPKVHLFQELCEYQACSLGTPEQFWTYRDESWCGHMSTAAKRRGGQKHASTVPERLLNRFRAMQNEAVVKF